MTKLNKRDKNLMKSIKAKVREEWIRQATEFISGLDFSLGDSIQFNCVSSVEIMANGRVFKESALGMWEEVQRG
jgi:hypothetical protein